MESLYEATDNGPEQLLPGFCSVSNFEKYPDRVCYVPENWDFDDGPGITANDILELCEGDKLKARMVFDLCDWQFPSTILGEWDQDDDLALDALRSKAEGTNRDPAILPKPFQDLMKNAKSRCSKNTGTNHTSPEAQR